MSTVPAPLSEFPRDHASAHADTSSRVAAGVLTTVLYGLFVLLIWYSFLNKSAHPAAVEIVATLLPDVPAKKIAPHPKTPFLVRLIRPRAETIAPPAFTIASSAPTTLAPLPATAAKSSPMLGGTIGNGAAGQAASANGSSGDGTAFAGCLDPVWMHAVTERVRQFFYFPQAALASHTTGVAMVRFVVRRDGRVSTVNIGKSSGDQTLDEAASNIMRLAEPLPPIPDRMHTDRVEGLLPMNFGVRSFHNTPTAGDCGD